MKDDGVYLLHIRDAIDRIFTYTSDGRDQFAADTKTQDAVVRNLEVIGEAVKALTSTLHAEHPHVPWRRIAGMRDRLIHQYFGIDLALVWDVVERDLPELRRDIQLIIETRT